MEACDEDVKCPTDFVVYGTALEPLEEDEGPRKPLPLHEQTVRDEKGRFQRFHGAFTGGFSAGYFNTVGSKEGWTPSTFVSSRQQKAEKQEATPRDFMDDEDLGEHGIAPSRIITTQPFASRAPRDVAEAPGSLAAALPGSELLDELIAPASAGVGAELLTRMGWKAGQGVGPRVKRKPRRQRVFGCAPPPTGSEESQEDDDDEFAPENATFAPKDVAAVDFGARAGVQGLGYRGLDPALALRGKSDAHLDFFSPHSDATSRLFGEKRRVSRRLGGVAGQAFGVGALEDDDDEDVYHRDAMSKYDTVLADEPGDGLYGWTAPRGGGVVAAGIGAGHRKEASYLGKILEGFAMARGSRENQTAPFPPPKLPDDYRPLRRFRRRVEVSHLSGVSAAPGGAGVPARAALPEDAGRHRVVAAQRGALLGEPVLPGPSSVMELLKPEDRQRLLRLRGGPEPTTSALRREEEAAAAAWRGLDGHRHAFKPFQKNDAKQARYEAYLERLRGGHKDAAEASLDPSMTEWERGREKEEFVRASVLYRPTSSALASRFTRAKDDDDGDAGDDRVEVPRDQEGSTEKDKEAAVRMKMFGQLTRESLEWHPDKILCKRFNVPHPYPGSAVVGLPKVKRDKFSIFNFLTVAHGDAPPPLASKKSRWDQEAVTEKESPAQTGALKEESSAVKSEPPDRARDGKQEAVAAAAEADEEESEGEADDEEEEEVEEETRPPMDVFKAIFAGSSDEASSSSSDGDDGDAGEDGERAPPADLFAVSSRQTATTGDGVSPGDGVPPAGGVSLAPPPREDGEFGPALPPPWFVPAATASPAREVGRKKRDKSKKDKKKKKSKKKKDKAKRQEDKKKKKTKAEGPSPHQDGRTEDLIGRIKRVSSGILR